MIKPLTRREHELLVVSLRRWIDIEKSAGNVTTAYLLEELVQDVERRPLRIVA